MSGFRPSPNFKHMRKYQKANVRLSNLAPTTPATTTQDDDSPTPPKVPKYGETSVLPEPHKELNINPVKTETPMEVTPQPEISQPDVEMPPVNEFAVTVKSEPDYEPPPLPNYDMPDIKPNMTFYFPPPLPPDVHPPLPLSSPPNIKPEVLEIKQDPTEMDYTPYQQLEQPQMQQPEEIMCYNFVRGTCKRGLRCPYVHKLILSQLNNVYRFCNDYINRGKCQRFKCRFVHATIYERNNFLQTGYLPAHTLAHQNEEIILPPPPPPAEPPPTIPMYYNLVPPPPPPQPMPLPSQPMPLPMQPMPLQLQPMPLQPQPMPLQPQPMPLQPQPMPLQPQPMPPPPPPPPPVPVPVQPIQPHAIPMIYQVPMECHNPQTVTYTSPSPSSSSSGYSSLVNYQKSPVLSTQFTTPPPPIPRKKICGQCHFSGFRLNYSTLKNDKLVNETKKLGVQIKSTDWKNEIVSILLVSVIESREDRSETEKKDRRANLASHLSALFSKNNKFTL